MVKVNGRIMSYGARDIFAYIGQSMFEHAFQCENGWCPCHASTFMDAICVLRDKFPEFKREVNELLDRKQYEIHSQRKVN